MDEVKVVMKTLPKLPYIQNIVEYYHRSTGKWVIGSDEYRYWLRQFGFAVPIRGDYLEFPDEFSDKDLTLFIIKWS